MSEIIDLPSCLLVKVVKGNPLHFEIRENNFIWLGEKHLAQLLWIAEIEEGVRLPHGHYGDPKLFFDMDSIRIVEVLLEFRNSEHGAEYGIVLSKGTWVYIPKLQSDATKEEVKG